MRGTGEARQGRFFEISSSRFAISWGNRFRATDCASSPHWPWAKRSISYSGWRLAYFGSILKPTCRAPLLPPPSGRNIKQKMSQIFWHNPPPPRLFREGVCQLATAARLISERKWPAEQIEMEPAIRTHGSLAYAVNILVKSSAGQILAAVEVKRNQQELAKLKRDFSHCCAEGEHTKVDCRFRSNHPNYQFCADHRPRYFWALAPGEDFCFELVFRNRTIDLVQLSTLPSRAILERPVPA